MNKKLGLFPIVCLLALTAGVTYAAVIYFIEVPMTMNIASVPGLTPYQSEDGTLEVTSLDLGEITPGIQKMTYDTYGWYFIYNTGNTPVYVSFEVTGGPPDSDLWYEMDYLQIETGHVPEGVIAPQILNPGEYLHWNLVINSVSTVWSGAYTPTLSFIAHDTL